MLQVETNIHQLTPPRHSNDEEGIVRLPIQKFQGQHDYRNKPIETDTIAIVDLPCYMVYKNETETQLSIFPVTSYIKMKRTQ